MKMRGRKKEACQSGKYSMSKSFRERTESMKGNLRGWRWDGIIEASTRVGGEKKSQTR